MSRQRAAARVVVGLTAAGLLVGALWAWLAPPAHGIIALSRTGNRIRAYLGTEADNFFIAAFLMIGFLSVVAVVAAVGVWQWRAHRGPLMVAALAVGGAVAAAAATGVGALLVRWRYGTVDVAAAPVTPEQRVYYFTEAPPVFFGPSPLQIAATIVFPAAAAALVYALLAVSTARDDLGGWPPMEYGPVPSADPALGPVDATGQTWRAGGGQPVDPSSPSR
ncbi:DUF2567 domain-containing protein [Mycolicibacterium thermoresistibile]